jgi:hypothetical protein
MRTNDVAVLDRIAQLNGLRSRHEVRAGQDLVVPESDVLAGVSVSNAVASRGARLANAYAQAAAQQATRDNAVTVTISGIASLLSGGGLSLGSGTVQTSPLSGWQRTQAHALGVYDAGVGAIESAGNSFGVVGTPESRVAWAMQTAQAAVEGGTRLINDPRGTVSGWWGALTGDDPAAIRHATAQGIGIASSVAGAGILRGTRLGNGSGVTMGAVENVGGIRTAEGVLYNAVTGPGPLGSKVANTFRSGSYTEVVTSETTTLYRVYGGKAKEIAPYWTRTEPRGPLQSVIDSALDPDWGNNATKVVRIEVPKGVTVYEGAAAPQKGLVGGGNQVFLPRINNSWIAR